MEINAKVVQALRDKIGAGMMECKNALVEAKGDVAEAEKILRKKGVATATKKVSPPRRPEGLLEMGRGGSSSWRVRRVVRIPTNPESNA